MHGEGRNKKPTLLSQLWTGSWLSHVVGLRGFARWDLVGITLLGDVWDGSSTGSFAELREEFSLQPSQFYKYLQLRHALEAHRDSLVEAEEFNTLEAKVLRGAMDRRGGLADIPLPNYSSTGWVCDTQIEVGEFCGELGGGRWARRLMAPRELAISSRLRLIQIKYLHMVYRSPAQLHRAFVTYPPGCTRCMCRFLSHDLVLPKNTGLLGRGGSGDF